MTVSKRLKKRRVLITGITGFVGSHLAKRLKTDGAEVYGTSRSKTAQNIFKVDVSRYSELESIINKYKIDTCYHLAGESLVENGQKFPYATFKTNILGTLNILEICRKHNVDRLIISSSSHVYGKNKLPYSEGYPLRPTRPYETSKATTDLIALSYVSSFKQKVFLPRFVNLYGPGDFNFNRIIPRTVKSVFFGKRPKVWGTKTMRDYLYIDDAVNAYITFLNANFSLERVFNIGSGNLVTADELVKKIINISGKKLAIRKITGERRDEIKAQYVTWKRAKNVLGWSPLSSLDEGLAKTYAWYADFFRSKRI